MTHAWIGVASRDHVAAAVDGEFCQLNHRKLAPLRQLHPGNHIVYYAPREQIRTGADLKAFVAIGRIQPGEPYQLRTSATFKPFRRSAVFYHGAATHRFIRCSHCCPLRVTVTLGDSYSDVVHSGLNQATLQ